MIDDDYLEEEQGIRQPPWFLLTGFLLGLGIGLLISMVISPVRYTDTAPASLAEEYKNNYRWLIARTYQANGDLIRAQQRLALLGDADPQEALAAQAQYMLAEGEAVEKARVLADLASALIAAADQPVNTPPPDGTSAPAAQPPSVARDTSQTSQTAPASELAKTPLPTFTVRIHPSQAPTLTAPFVLVKQEEVCDPSLDQGLLQIILTDTQGQPAAGVQIHVAWDGGLDTFYTGLKPSISPGYADFAMTPRVIYSLRVGGSSDTVRDLVAPQCQGETGSYPGSLRLEFSQQ